ncbi:N-acetylmuramoyl-L-alanine amidase [Pontibacter sp. G13]|uniref:N-acetylmuramoyl-L-alanine amidase family protein n=1 Tax=Pontibacter sp. G13 TaxID=3074898 RepID=UPI00288BD8AE|nr:N-acetylmuramoyl-L-alanine amidase [Pontibacter sp. G13]WNJ19516.1 N-acetylmuramoyl-L-alanine amidase [Pontibacter sp. G13]
MNIRKMLSCWLLLSGLVTSLFAQTNQPHLIVKAQKGDGVLALLSKYQIRSTCNIDYFYQINQLKKGAGLIAEREYYLPIFVYNYNGKSIRSTTDIHELPWAQKIQKYNELMHAGGLKSGDYREDLKLWVPYNQIYCKSEPFDLLEAAGASISQVASTSTPSNTRLQRGVQPASNSPARGSVLRGVYPIFGPNYARVPLESDELRGQVYYIVGGHGGPDPGAVGNYNNQSLCEDEYAYDIALRLARNLLANGATVYIITRDDDDGIREGEVLPCDKDETCWLDQEIPVSQVARLNQRSHAVNSLYRKNIKQGVTYQRMIVIHVDAGTKSRKIDMYYYYKRGDQAGKAFTDQIKKTIKAKYEYYRKDRGYSGTVSTRDLHMLRETDVPAVFIELGNIKNPVDQGRFVVEGNRQLVANWLFEGIVADPNRP